ncbi:MAG: hypothetical protein ACJAUP_001362 [Cellvibrionaceae bacterium]|jgi:hypothetical protein
MKKLYSFASGITPVIKVLIALLLTFFIFNFIDFYLTSSYLASGGFYSVTSVINITHAFNFTISATIAFIFIMSI